MKFYFMFISAKQIQENKYAKVKNNAMLKINIDNYQCYLLAMVWIFKSSGYDFSPILFILWVHLSVLEMETLMIALLVMVTLMTTPPFPSIHV